MTLDDVFCLQHPDVRTWLKGGAARLLRGSLVAPLYYRIHDGPTHIQVGDLDVPTKAEWIVTTEELWDYVPEIPYNGKLIKLTGYPSVEYFVQQSIELHELGMVRLPQEVFNRMKGTVQVGFVLYLPDLKP